MLDMLRTVGNEINEIYKTGSALVGQGCNRLLDTTAMKKVSEVTSPVFTWAKDHTPESIKKNKLFFYGAGTVVAIRIPLYFRNNHINNYLNHAANLADRSGDAAKAGRIRDERV